MEGAEPGVGWWWVLLLCTQAACTGNLASQGGSMGTSWLCEHALGEIQGEA